MLLGGHSYVTRGHSDVTRRPCPATKRSLVTRSQSIETGSRVRVFHRDITLRVRVHCSNAGRTPASFSSPCCGNEEFQVTEVVLAGFRRRPASHVSRAARSAGPSASLKWFTCDFDHFLSLLVTPAPVVVRVHAHSDACKGYKAHFVEAFGNLALPTNQENPSPISRRRSLLFKTLKVFFHKPVFCKTSGAQQLAARARAYVEESARGVACRACSQARCSE
eukprot:393752-Prorocentrum_minimum.AAC.1